MRNVRRGIRQAQFGGAIVLLTLAAGVAQPSPPPVQVRTQTFTPAADTRYIPEDTSPPTPQPVQIQPGYTYWAEVDAEGEANIYANYCEEDQPCWDCATMGNHICGTLPETS